MRYSAFRTFWLLVFLCNYSNLMALSLTEAEEKANGVCAGCHGKDGVNGVLPYYPIIAGQHEDYLNQALMDYKSGARKNAVMSGIATTLTKAEMKALAKYFASLPTPLNDKNRIE